MFPRLSAIIIWLFILGLAQAATDTWDGGGGNDDILTDSNWLDDSAPSSDIDTTDLIFAGETRLTPNFSASFAAHSVRFDNTAGAFTLSGAPLTIGLGGIVNNDADTQTFGNIVTLGMSASFNAGVGGLLFTSGVTLDGNVLSLDGTNAFSFINFTTAGAVNKNGTGTMSWSPNVAQDLTFTINAGTVNTAADGSADIFSSTASIAVNNTSILNLNESLTLDGAQLTRASGAAINLAAGKMLTVQNGGEANFIGSFSNNTASTILVTGAGSTLSTSASLSINGGSKLQIQSGAIVTGTELLLANAGSTSGTVTITGTGSALTLSAAATIGAASGNTGTFNVQTNGVFNSGTGLTTVNATGTIAITGGTYNSKGDLTLNGGQLTRDPIGIFSLTNGATLTIQGGGDAIITGIYTTPNNTSVNVRGSGSTFSTTSTLTVGNGSTIAASSGGHISSGSGATLISTSGGNGAVIVDGAGSNFTADTLIIGRSGFTGTATFSNGSTGSANGILVDASVVNGTVGTLTIQSGASLTGTSLDVAGTAAPNSGTVTISGIGSALTLSGMATIGAPKSSSGTVNVENGGTFTTGTDLTTVNATGNLNVNAGGTMIVRGDMIVHGSLAIAGTVILDGSAPLVPATDELIEHSAPEFGAIDSEQVSGALGEIVPATSSGDSGFDDRHLPTPSTIAGIPEPHTGALLPAVALLLGFWRPKQNNVVTSRRAAGHFRS